jgi:hypothetical protein
MARFPFLQANYGKGCGTSNFWPGSLSKKVDVTFYDFPTKSFRLLRECTACAALFFVGSGFLSCSFAPSVQ